VSPVANNFYAQWRLQSGTVALLRENQEPPPELLLQAIWQHQRLLRDQLQTLDGESLRVLHPGFVNREGGPDFRGAVVQFGQAPARSGDVEVDLSAGGWRAHGHDRNPAFDNVILHVIWDCAAGTQVSGGKRKESPFQPRLEVKPTPPTVAIRDKLDAPVGELSLWLNSDAPEGFPETLRGQCCSPLRELSAAQVSELLREAAQIRFRSKAGQLQARARQVGWDQALWEGLFRALGYKHNTWPMQCLAEQRQRWGSPLISPLALQARLLGISGLLPSELSRARVSADGYLRRVWDQWWREREEFADCVLPRTLWRFHGQRPANHPQRRLALAAHWLTNNGLASSIERWCAQNVPDERLADSLLEVFQTGPDDFWSWHWTMRSARLKRPQPLIGAGRATDLAVNVVLPWLWIRAAEGRNKTLQSAIEQRFNAWPPAEDNAVLRLARQRLLGGAARRALRSAVEQQGLIQIVRDFCDHSNAVCDQCGFPKLVKAWRGR
jgi:Protein of unknown function (DUF2851)